MRIYSNKDAQEYFKSGVRRPRLTHIKNPVHPVYPCLILVLQGVPTLQ